ncbi:hypothetical protein Ahy_A02g008934 [Arachis hypogaea]|uniref:Uncharacterized protein n=1 Tax=Arachis hypogaea TaxID=3818 RepID=A0A445EFR5_ARAHY|nr:hypothetical protein Ahy_A02g008934 [Arachis hypogaea]
MQEAGFKVYEVEFLLIPYEKLWPEWYVTCFCPNPAIRKKARRPVFTRSRNEMDEVEHQEKRMDICNNNNISIYTRKS